MWRLYQLYGPAHSPASKSPRNRTTENHETALGERQRAPPRAASTVPDHEILLRPPQGAPPPFPGLVKRDPVGRQGVVVRPWPFLRAGHDVAVALEKSEVMHRHRRAFEVRETGEIPQVYERVPCMHGAQHLQHVPAMRKRFAARGIIGTRKHHTLQGLRFQGKPDKVSRSFHVPTSAVERSGSRPRTACSRPSLASDRCERCRMSLHPARLRGRQLIYSPQDAACLRVADGGAGWCDGAVGRIDSLPVGQAKRPSARPRSVGCGT